MPTALHLTAEAEGMIALPTGSFTYKVILYILFKKGLHQLLLPSKLCLKSSVY